MVEEIIFKICIKCNTKKILKEFKIRESGKHRNECKDCQRQYQLEYQQRPEVKKRKFEYSQRLEWKKLRAEREKIRRQNPSVEQKRKEYYQRPEVKKRRKLWAREARKKPKNKQWAKEYQQRPDVRERDRTFHRKPEYKKRTNERLALKWRTNPRFKLNNTISRGMATSLKGNKGRRHWESLVDFDLKNLRKHLERQFQIGMSWENYGQGMGKWHVDHIVPISVFNFTKPEDIDFKKCWCLKNLQPMWGHENISKHSKLDKPFQPSLAIGF
jgi:hypothetical protein